MHPKMPSKNGHRINEKICFLKKEILGISE